MSLIDISLLSLVEIFGDFKLKDYARTNQLSSLAQGISGYIGVIYFLIRSFKGGNILYVNAMWDGISALFESIAAYHILGERLNTISQYFGIVLICIGIGILNLGGISK